MSPDGVVVESCAVLTRSSKPRIDQLHERMPCVLSEEQLARWLDPALTDTEEIKSLLTGEEGVKLTVRLMSTRWNNVRNDDEGVLVAEAS